MAIGLRYMNIHIEQTQTYKINNGVSFCINQCDGKFV